MAIILSARALDKSISVVHGSLMGRITESFGGPGVHQDSTIHHILGINSRAQLLVGVSRQKYELIENAGNHASVRRDWCCRFRIQYRR